MKNSVKNSLDALHLSDVYSLMLFLLYKVQDIPEYAVLSELCYMLDGSNLTRLLTYFAGKTIRVPTQEEFIILINALLIYQYVLVDGMTLTDAKKKFPTITPKQWQASIDLYVKILPIMKNYSFDRNQVQKNV